MPLEHDGEDDAPVFGAPLPPEDRLWRHPSELKGATDLQPAGVPAPPRVWGIAVVSGLVGAVLTVGVVTATVGIGTQHARTAVERVDALPVGASLVASSVPNPADAVARALRPSIARVAVGSKPVIGSAVVFRDDGYLLTTASLVKGASDVTVTLDGAQLKGRVTGVDTPSDLAVVHVDRTGLTPMVVSRDQVASVGQRVFVIGASANTDPTVSAGVVGTSSRQSLETDVAADPAALGGALSDERGIVLGIVTRATGAAGANAVAIATAMSIGDDIATNGKAKHVWLGVEGNDLDVTAASSMQLPGGATLTKVTEGSPAGSAGLREGDVITAVDGIAITSMSELVTALRQHDAGETIDVEYWRDGSSHHCSAKLAER